MLSGYNCKPLANAASNKDETEKEEKAQNCCFFSFSRKFLYISLFSLDTKLKNAF